MAYPYRRTAVASQQHAISFRPAGNETAASRRVAAQFKGNSLIRTARVQTAGEAVNSIAIPPSFIATARAACGPVRDTESP